MYVRYFRLQLLAAPSFVHKVLICLKSIHSVSINRVHILCWGNCIIPLLCKWRHLGSWDQYDKLLLDFPVRECPLWCSSRNWSGKSLAQNLQLKVGTAASPPVGNWTGFVKKRFSFFSLRKINWKKRATYYWVQPHTYTKIWWGSVLKLQWVQLKVGLQLDPPTPKVGNWNWIRKGKIFIFFTEKINWKTNFVTRKFHLLAPKPTHLVINSCSCWRIVEPSSLHVLNNKDFPNLLVSLAGLANLPNLAKILGLFNKSIA